jgi:hypothetical protein
MVVVWAGCKPDAKVAADTKTVAAADSNHVGTFTLMTVDGTKVAYTVQQAGHKPTIKSGSFTLNAEGTCCSMMSGHLASRPSEG